MAGILPTTYGGSGGGILDNLIGSMAAASAVGPGNAVLQQRFLQSLQQDPRFQQLTPTQQYGILNDPEQLRALNMGQTINDVNGTAYNYNPFTKQIAPVYSLPVAPKEMGTAKVGEMSFPVYSQGSRVNVVSPEMIGGGAPQAPTQAGQPMAQPAQPSAAPQPGQPQASGLDRLMQINNQMTEQKAAADVRGKTQETGKITLPDQRALADNAIALIDKISKNPQLGSVVGLINGNLPPFSGAQADIINNINQLKSQAFLQGINALKGPSGTTGFRMTQYEAQRLEGALANLDRVSSDAGFAANLKVLRDTFAGIRDRLYGKAGLPTPPQDQTQPQAPQPQSSTGQNFQGFKYLGTR